MSFHGAPPGSGAGPRPVDPIGAYFGAMRDVWDMGLSALQAVSGAAGSAEGSGLFAAVMTPLASMATALEDLLKQASQGGQPAMGAVQGAATQMADMAPAMAQASAIAAASTLRYWRALASIAAQHQSGLMQAAAARVADTAAASPAECREMADTLRTFFREVGDAATQEARRLQAELEEVGERIAQMVEHPDPSTPHQRRWKAKE